jgi:hypothetical protein
VLITHIKNINKKDGHANTEKKSLLQGDSKALTTFLIDIKYIPAQLSAIMKIFLMTLNIFIFLNTKMVYSQPASCLKQATTRGYIA